MNADLEFNGWRAEWQTQVEPSLANAADVRRKALSQQRRLRAGNVLELLAGVTFLAVSTAVAWKVPSVEAFLWAGAVWLTTLIVSAFSVWNWRILWNTNLKSVSEFAQEYEKRCRAEARAAHFGKRFIFLQALISVPWLTWDYHRGHLSISIFIGAVLLLIVLSLGFWAMFSHYRRAALRELNGIREIRNTANSFGRLANQR